MLKVQTILASSNGSTKGAPKPPRQRALLRRACSTMKNAQLTRICVIRAVTLTRHVRPIQMPMVALGALPLCRGPACISMKSAHGRQPRALDVAGVTMFAALIRTPMVTICVWAM